MADELLEQFVDNSAVSEKLWDDAVAECSKAGHRTLVQGFWKEGDVCLRKCYLRAGHERLKRVHEYVEHPTDGVKDTRKIHAVLAYDHRGDGKDRGADIIEGGIGQSHIKIELEGKSGRAIEFTVVILGQ